MAAATIDLGTDETLAKLIAKELVKQAMPQIAEMVQYQVGEAMPRRGLTRGELAQRLHMSNASKGQAKEDFDRIAAMIPSYPVGSERRYDSGAVDKFMETYEGGY